jgi:soluble lytic murein transglycosylase-like protein
MSGIKIPVEAKLDQGDLNQSIQQFVTQFNKLGAAVAQANKVKFDPIGKATIDDLRKVREQFDSLQKISGALSRRMKDTGQGGKGFFDLDWGRLYSDPNARAREMRKAFEYVTGRSFGAGAAPAPGVPPRPAPVPPPAPPVPPPSPSASWRAHGRGIVGAGLRATGGMGAAADNALSAGAAGGLAVGTGAFVGGLVALGVSKIIGGVMSKVGDAQDELIQIDTLKRALGDVNVGFGTLKASLRDAADDLQVPINEAGRLGSAFAKIADLAPSAHKTLADEIAIGGGFGRSFGMSPATSNAFFAQMRLLQTTTNARESRSLALTIGEAIARSGAFAKADEVLQAIGNFATQQTRLGLVSANVPGYAGLMAGMVATKTPGLDPAGAARVIGAANAAVARGGAAGEAGQFFLMQALGTRLGLNPVQTKVLEEQGLFGTGARTFGKGGLYDQYARAFGGRTPSTDGAAFHRTVLSLVMGNLERMYAGRPDLMADAMSNLFGVNTSQAMALAVTAHDHPGALGGIQARLKRAGIDLSKVNATGIEALARVETGDRSVLEAQANDLLGRTGSQALSKDERDRLRTAMAGGDTEKLRDVLAALTATRSQQETLGRSIRQGLVGIQNELQRTAGKLVSPLNDIRIGVLSLAGVGKGMGPIELREKVRNAERDEIGRLAGKQAKVVNNDYDAKVEAEHRHRELLKAKLDARALTQPSRMEQMTPAQQEADRASMRALEAQIAESRKRELDLGRQRDAELAQVEAERKRRVAEWKAKNPAYTPGTDGTLVDAVIAQESGGRNTDPKTGKLLTSPAGAQGLAQVMPATGKDPGFGVVPLKDHSPAEARRFAKDYLGALIKHYGGDRRKALAAYNAGPGRIDALVAKYGGDWLAHAPGETQNYVPGVLGRLPKSDGEYDAPVPGTGSKLDGRAGPWDQYPSRGPLFRVEGSFVLHDQQGREVAAPIKTITSAAVPYGAR